MATPEDEDATQLLQAAAREHIPINPDTIKELTQAPAKKRAEERTKVPLPHERDSIDQIINHMQECDWYKGQIVHRKRFDPRPPQMGNCKPNAA